MSYCRFSNAEYNYGDGLIIPKSDVYIFESDFGCECCGCRLNVGNSVWMSTKEMISHVQEHIKHGDTVPNSVIPALEAEVKAQEQDSSN